MKTVKMEKSSPSSPVVPMTISQHRALHTGHVAGLCELGGKDTGFSGAYPTRNALQFARQFVGKFKCEHPSIRMSDGQWTEMIDELAEFYSSHRV